MSNVDPARRVENPAGIFAALGDQTRLQLMYTLSDGQWRSIVQLSDGFQLTRQAVSRHLSVLEQVGMVRRKRVGRESRYVYVPESISHARSCLQALSAQWDDALGRLKEFVES